MRLPWPFGRSQPSAATREPSDVFMTRLSGPQAWRDLPVIPRSVGAAPLIAPTPPFREDLAGAAPAPIVLAPLTHGHGLDAPTGLAHNVLKAVNPEPGSDTRERGARSALPPLRRRQQESAASELVPMDASAAELSSSALVPTSSSLPAAGLPRPPVTANTGAGAGSMVRADRQAALPPLPMGRVGPARTAGVQRAPMNAAPVVDATPVAKPPIDAALARVALTAISPTAVGSDRLTLGQSRRMGLGAPIIPGAALPPRARGSTESIPAAPTAAKPPDAQDVPNAATDLHTPTPDLTLASSAPRTDAMSLASPTISNASPWGTTSAPIENVPSRVPFAPAPSPSSMTAAPLRQRPTRPAAASEASRPLVGGRSPTNVQRAPLATQASALPAASPASSGPGPSVAAGAVRVHRGGEVASLAGALDARAFTSGGEVFLPARHGPISGQKAQSLLAHELTHVSQQRRLGSSLPHEDSAHGRLLEADAVSAESSRSMPLAIAVSGEQSAPAQTPEQATSTAPTAGPFAAPHAADLGSVQRARSANDAKFTDPDDAFRDKLDSNEDYLFSKFERRLRHILLHERERGGSLIDAL